MEDEEAAFVHTHEKNILGYGSLFISNSIPNNIAEEEKKIGEMNDKQRFVSYLKRDKEAKRNGGKFVCKVIDKYLTPRNDVDTAVDGVRNKGGEFDTLDLREYIQSKLSEWQNQYTCNKDTDDNIGGTTNPSRNSSELFTS